MISYGSASKQSKQLNIKSCMSAFDAIDYAVGQDHMRSEPRAFWTRRGWHIDAEVLRSRVLRSM